MPSGFFVVIQAGGHVASGHPAVRAAPGERRRPLLTAWSERGRDFLQAFCWYRCGLSLLGRRLLRVKADRLHFLTPSGQGSKGKRTLVTKMSKAPQFDRSFEEET